MKYPKVKCPHCSNEYANVVIKRHEESCYLNPKNKRDCEACGTSIADWKYATTCSTGCYNTLYRSGPNNPNWKSTSYRSTCFHYHEKKCIICDFDYVVDVHHVDEDKSNNSPENLVPLCPNHHEMFHSKHRDIVQPLIEQYLEEFKVSGCSVEVT